MKKIYYAILFFTMALFLTACGEEGEIEADENFPDRDIEMVIPFGPGGATDAIFRIIAEEAEEYLGVSIVPTNMDGGGSTIGSRYVKDSSPDGYTILASHDTIATNYLSGTADYSFDAFEPISLLTETPNIPSVNSDSDMETALDVVQYIEEQPGVVSVGMIPGSTDHFFMAQFMQINEIDEEKVNLIGYADTGSQVEALLANDIEFSMLNIPSGRSYFEAGSLRPVGIAGEDRLEEHLPETPTLIELGIEFTHSTNRGIWAPEGTPEEHIDIISQAFESALQNEDVIDQINNQLGSVAKHLPPEEFEEYLVNLEEELNEVAQNIDFGEVEE